MHFNQSHWGPMEEGQPYDLQCDAVDVVPTADLVVIWHKGDEILDDSRFSSASNNATWLTRLTPHRDDDGSEMWCEVIMHLLPTGQGHRDPAVKSERRKLTVRCEFIFIFHGNSKMLSNLISNFTSDCILI